MTTRTGWLSATANSSQRTLPPAAGPAVCGSASTSPLHRRCPGSPGASPQFTGCSRYVRPRSSVTESPDLTSAANRCPGSSNLISSASSRPGRPRMDRRCGSPGSGMTARKRSFTPPGVSVAPVSTRSVSPNAIGTGPTATASGIPVRSSRLAASAS